MTTRVRPIPIAALAIAMAVAATGCKHHHKKKAAPLPPAPFSEVIVEAPQGLSGLAADAAGALWSVTERHGEIAEISLATTPPAVTRFHVGGVPADTDLEGIEVWDNGDIAIAAEGQHTASASLLVGHRLDDGFQLVQTIALPREVIGVDLTENHGAEAVCGEGDAMAVGIEVVGIDAGKRYAPIVRLVGGKVVATQKLWLTSDKGKLSALDCHFAADGTVTGWAIERHYGITRILRFALPAPGQAGDAAAGILAIDLEPYLHGRLNLEGIAELPDGRVIAVNDNETDKITGPTELLVFPAGALGALPAPPTGAPAPPAPPAPPTTGTGSAG